MGERSSLRGGGIWGGSLRFEYRGCQAVWGRRFGGRMSLNCCKYGVKWALKIFENSVHSVVFKLVKFRKAAASTGR